MSSSASSALNHHYAPPSFRRGGLRHAHERDADDWQFPSLLAEDGHGAPWGRDSSMCLAWQWSPSSPPPPPAPSP
eukprot:3016250-Pyramimonas_sp.AAC.1